MNFELARYHAEIDRLIESRNLKAMYSYKKSLEAFMAPGVRAKVLALLKEYSIPALKRIYTADPNKHNADLLKAKIICILTHREMGEVYNYLTARLD
jgi:hypothetical protein